MYYIILFSVQSDEGARRGIWNWRWGDPGGGRVSKGGKGGVVCNENSFFFPSSVNISASIRPGRAVLSISFPSHYHRYPSITVTSFTTTRRLVGPKRCDVIRSQYTSTSGSNVRLHVHEGTYSWNLIIFVGEIKYPPTVPIRARIPAAGTHNILYSAPRLQLGGNEEILIGQPLSSLAPKTRSVHAVRLLSRSCL